jgi:RND family efflux transporter MFP subunit
MKEFRKISVIIILVAIVSLLIFTLITNKQAQDRELQSMLDFSYQTPVEVTNATVGTANITLKENGITEAAKEISVISETQGKIIAMNGKVGEQVAAGQILVEVEKELLQDQLKLADTNLQNAKNDLERFKKLHQGNAVTGQQLDNMQLNYQNALTNYNAVKEQLANAVIRAPISGIISHVHLETGAHLSPGSPVMSIMDEQEVSFKIRVAARDISQLKVDMLGGVILDVARDKTYIGRIDEIGISSDMSGRYPVWVSLENAESGLKSGLSGIASFNLPVEKNHIVIPRKSIYGSMENPSVFLIKGDTAYQRIIKALPINEAEVAVLEGIAPGDIIVTSGHMNLENGTQVKILNAY